MFIAHSSEDIAQRESLRWKSDVEIEYFHNEIAWGKNVDNEKSAIIHLIS